MHPFILDVVSYARNAQRLTGIPVSVSVAQAIHESGWGRSGLATKGKNLFGIKAGGSWDGPVYWGTTWEFENGQRVTYRGTGKIYPNVDRALEHADRLGISRRICRTALFRAYEDYAGSFLSHAELFYRVPRYAPALAYRAQPYKFLELIAPVYATDPNYATLVANIMRGRDLVRLDVPPEEWDLSPKYVPEHHIKTWARHFKK